MTRISVIIPTYNRAYALERAIDSALNQAVKPHEILVVDDGSTDNTEDVLLKYKGLRVIRLAQNAGAAGARNVGVNAATGDWIAFLDSDDEWLPEKLAIQLQVKEDKPDVGLICCGIRVTGKSGVVEEYKYDYTRPSDGWTIEHILHYAFCPSTWLIARSKFLGYGGFDDSLPNCEDVDLLAKLLPNQCIEMIPRVLVKKYNQPDSLDANYEKLEHSIAILFERHSELWRAAPKAEEKVWLRLAGMRLTLGALFDARRAYASAISCNPATFKSWFWYLLSFTGPRMFYGVRRVIAYRNSITNEKPESKQNGR